MYLYLNNTPGSKKNSIFNVIKSRYGLETFQLLRNLVSQNNRIARHQRHLFFNHSCLRKDFLPKTLRFKSPLNTAVGRLARNFGFRFIKLRINKSLHWIRTSLTKIADITRKVLNVMTKKDYEFVIEWTTKKRNTLKGKLFNYYKKKLDKLLNTDAEMHKDVKHRKNWVINLSKQKLTETETDVLRLGLTFGATQKIIPKQNIIAEVEIPNASANIIRGKIVNTLNQPNTHQPNLTSEQRKALQVLIKQVDLVITRADKGNCTVILDKSDYEEKMHKLLNDNSTYMLLKHDLTGNIEKKLKKYVYQLFKTKSISQNEYYHLHNSDANAPRIYGLPKIHKPQTPLRPIVSFINSSLYNLSKFLQIFYHH